MFVLLFIIPLFLSLVLVVIGVFFTHYHIVYHYEIIDYRRNSELELYTHLYSDLYLDFSSFDFGDNSVVYVELIASAWNQHADFKHIRVSITEGPSYDYDFVFNDDYDLKLNSDDDDSDDDDSDDEP